MDLMGSAIRRDERRGHFVFDLEPDGAIKREVVAVDLGPVLHIQTSGAHLTPGEARELADALRWWADRNLPARVIPPGVRYHLRAGRLHLAATCSGELGCTIPPESSALDA